MGKREVDRPKHPRGHPPLDLSKSDEDPSLEPRKTHGTVASKKSGPHGEDRPHSP